MLEWRNNMIKKNLLGERLKEIIYAIPSFDDVDTRLSDAILPLLSTTRLMEGYNLSVFKYGDYISLFSFISSSPRFSTQ